MSFLDVILTILDSRSFATIWYWIMLVTVWTMVGRNVLGVPADVIRSVPRHPAGTDTAEALILLDWLSLVLPRWRLGRVDGMWLMGIAAFLSSTLILLGFVYGLEMAIALVILLFPVALNLAAGLWLAARLQNILGAAQAHRITPNQAAAEAAYQMRWYRAAMLYLPLILLMLGFASLFGPVIVSRGWS